MTDHDIAPPSPGVLEAAAELLANCRLADVRPTKVRAEVLDGGLRSVSSIDIRPSLEFAVGPGQFSNRFSYEFDLKHIDGDNVAEIEFILQVDWAVPEDFTPDREAADFVSSTTGYFAVYPYCRELLQSLSSRLGIDPVVLGALHKGEIVPSDVSIVTRGATSVSTQLDPPHVE